MLLLTSSPSRKNRFRCGRDCNLKCNWLGPGVLQLSARFCCSPKRLSRKGISEPLLTTPNSPAGCYLVRFPRPVYLRPFMVGRSSSRQGLCSELSLNSRERILKAPSLKIPCRFPFSKVWKIRQFVFQLETKGQGCTRIWSLEP